MRRLLKSERNPLGLEYHDADDIAQKVMLDMWLKLKGGIPRFTIAWVKEIIDNAKIDLLRKQQREAEIFAPMPETEDPEDERDIELVFPCEEAEAVFRLQHEGYSLREIAMARETTLGSLEVQMSRWRKKISVSC